MIKSESKNPRHMAYIHPKTECSRNRVAWYTYVRQQHIRAFGERDGGLAKWHDVPSSNKQVGTSQRTSGETSPSRRPVIGNTILKIFKKRNTLMLLKIGGTNDTNHLLVINYFFIYLFIS